MTAICASGDNYRFFRAWLSNPLRVASVAPSSLSLSRLMTQEIPPNARVVELGPGTGVFTRALLDRGISQANLTLVEYGPEFIGMLQKRFPEATVLQMDAARLGGCDLFQGRQAGAIVSGLPLLSMSPRKVMQILSSGFTHLQPGGSFYQFTYGPRCPVPSPILDRLGLEAVRIGSTIRNLPPASVYRISQITPLAANKTKTSRTDVKGLK
ncbi:class I SAM-dependent methyltransferase [Pararhizobium sp.]|uniref:class I SAM-dependent methyltransferase n=1 Tax=Pararhizobium sp. TaxID=1977563 RepID=UPI0027252CFD|nr:methyltransferase domain-containing protein [Pararhizobium sp.]MDO9416580.1 methyltransferase domain-containing protein [Pararhizobium sp.]